MKEYTRAWSGMKRAVGTIHSAAIRPSRSSTVGTRERRKGASVSSQRCRCLKGQKAIEGPWPGQVSRCVSLVDLKDPHGGACLRTVGPGHNLEPDGSIPHLTASLLPPTTYVSYKPTYDLTSEM